MAVFMSTRRYIALSLLSAAAVVWHAFSTREQFFPSMVYLGSSKFSLAVLGNMGIAFALATYKIILRVFLGRLRDSEVERVNDKVGQAVVETCLAMTIFREDFTASFFTMFVILSFVKIFHWLVQDRVDFIETTPNVTRLQHLRIATFALVLLAIDLTFLHYSLSKTLEHGVSVHLLFAFEYTVQASTIVLTFIKYCLSMADMAMEGRWEGKGVAVFYLELTLDMLHLFVYCAFFAIVFSTYGIPLHLVRDLYWTFRNFQTRVRDFLRFRRITANMDQSFPEASEEDLQRADHTCIICREEMSTAGRNKKLGCTHVFHLHCLRSWLERQQNCPICRRSVVPPPPPMQAGAAPGAAAPDPLALAAEQLRLAAMDDVAEVEHAGGAAGIDLDEGHAHAAARHVPPPTAPQQQQQLRRRRGGRTHAAGGEVGAGAAPGVAVEGGWHMVAPYPQWVPAASMALFMPAGGLQQLQYAGQQHPEQVLQAQQAAAAAGMMPFMMPLTLPFVLPPILASPTSLPAPPATAAALDATPAAAQQQQQAAALAAATPQQHMAAVAATAAAAASMLLPACAGMPVPAPTDPATAAATAAAAAALEHALRQQLRALRAHQERAQQVQQAAASGHSGAITSASTQTPPPPAPAPAPAPPSVPDAAAVTPVAGAGSAPAALEAAPAPVPAEPGPPQAQRAGVQPQQPQRQEDEEGEPGDLRRRRLERFGDGA